MSFLNLFRKPKQSDLVENLTSNVKTVYHVVNKYSKEIHKSFMELDLVSFSESQPNYQLLEIMIFVLWEFDVTLFSAKIDMGLRQDLISLIVKNIHSDFLNEDQHEIFNKTLLKRFVEYSEGEKSDVKIGSPQDLITNFLVYNIKYAQDEHSFYYTDTVRSLSLEYFTQLSVGQYVLYYHFRIRGFFLEIFGKNTDSIFLDHVAFADLIGIAEKKDQEASNKYRDILKI
jgi:hypothetical protein